MLTETIQSIATASRNVLRNWQAMLLIAAVYAVLLVLLYLFVAVREATVTQVTLTFTFAVVAPLLFFLLQAMIAAEGSSSAGTGVGFVLRKSLTSFWKVVLISLPLIALAIGIGYLLSKAQNHFSSGVNDTLANLPHALSETARGQKKPNPINWRASLFSTIRYLAFGLFLPLVAIHLWLVTVREGLGAALRRIAHLFARAFAPRSVLIYVLGFVFFAVAPYFVLFKTTQTKHAWIELFLLVARLFIVFALTLLGWTITVRALGQAASSLPEQPNEAA